MDLSFSILFFDGLAGTPKTIPKGTQNAVENRRDMPVSALPFFPLSQWQSVSSCDGGAVTVSSISSGTTVSLAKGIGLP